MSLKQKSQKKPKPMKSKTPPKFGSRAWVRKQLYTNPGGWTSYDTPRKLKLKDQRAVIVKPLDRAMLAQKHLDEVLKPILKGTGIRVTFDKKSFIDYAEDPTFDDRTVISCIHNKSAEDIKKRLGYRGFENLMEAEDKALVKAFGRKAISESGITQVENIEPDSYSWSCYMLNPWNKEYN